LANRPTAGQKEAVSRSLSRLRQLPIPARQIALQSFLRWALVLWWKSWSYRNMPYLLNIEPF